MSDYDVKLYEIILDKSMTHRLYLKQTCPFQFDWLILLVVMLSTAKLLIKGSFFGTTAVLNFGFRV